MFCENCGKEIISDIRFCSECGAEIRIPCFNLKNLQNDKQRKTGIYLKRVENEATASIYGYNYNWGHFLAFIGAALELLSLFLPNKTDLLKMDGITMLDYLKMLVQQILRNLFESIEELDNEYILIYSNIIIIVYFVDLIYSCIRIETNSLIITSVLNMAIVAYTSYTFYDYSNNIINSAISVLQNNKTLATGLGYLLFLISGIIILAASAIAKMLSINEKYKTNSKSF